MITDNRRKLERYLAEVLAIVAVLSVCKSYNITRLADGSGDIFQKGTFVYQNKIIRIDVCDRDVKSATYAGKDCKCTWGRTFYIKHDQSLSRPTCMDRNEAVELGCGLRFHGVYSDIKVIELETSMTQDIGTVGSHPIEKIQTILNVSIWNVTWQLQQEDLFKIKGKKLKWKSRDQFQVARNYEGILFKVYLVVKRANADIPSCIFFKIDGIRDYALPRYVERPSTTVKLQTTTIKSKVPSVSTSIIISVSKKQRPTFSSFAISPTPSYKKTSILLTSLKDLTSELKSPTILPTKSTFAHPTTTNKILPSLTSKMVMDLTTVKQSSFQSFALSSHIDYKGLTITMAVRTDLVASSATSSKLPTSSITTNPDGNTGKQQSSNAGMIAGTSVGVIVAITVAVFAVVFIYRRRLGRRHPSVDEIRRRKGTMTLDLTANTFSNRGLSFQNPVKKDVGNPMYTDKLRFNSVSANGESNTELYEYAYENGKKQDEKPGEAIYKEIDDDGKMEPIYREIETEEPIYHETESEYQPIDEAKLDSPANYEALNTVAFPKEEPSYLKPVQAPIYQELEEENSAVDKTKDEPSGANLVQAPIYQVLEEENDGKHNNNRNAKNEIQSPVYQTLNPEVYEELDRSSTKSPDAVYSKLDLADKNRPKQEPLYDVLARESGTSNIQYDDDEAEI
eukprot:Seg2163.8 transcript_id=Seg2163.8/GoldUCD/mRNA.D3Y31 product="hypothetical protein" protein_id=Seg2163.8/GoldUCD/D3Y31